MKWKKLGLLTNIIERIPWAISHAQVPTTLVLNDRIRVYFATRPKPDLTLTTYCDLNKHNPTEVLYVHTDPILELGAPGTFDQHGIMPSSIVERDGLIYLYYSGWSRSVGVPYSNYTGLAISDDGGATFRKKFEGPILDRTVHELFSATSPEVIYNEQWHMWYCSGTNWHHVNGKWEHTYDIKYATSEDGLRWMQQNRTAIQQKDSYEAITKPTVLSGKGSYHMWYCYRGSHDFRNGLNSYRIGYATSENLQEWNRSDDNSGLSVSEEGWDSNMVAYPAVCQLNDLTYLFYNGNSFGKEGFGVAILNKII